MRDDWLDWEVAKVKHDCTSAKGTAQGCEVKKGEASATCTAEKDSEQRSSAILLCCGALVMQAVARGGGSRIADAEMERR
jgi:hypothetical protein